MFTVCQPLFDLGKRNLYYLTCTISPKMTTMMFKIKNKFQRDVFFFFNKSIKEWSIPVKLLYDLIVTKDINSESVVLTNRSVISV